MAQGGCRRNCWGRCRRNCWLVGPIMASGSSPRCLPLRKAGLHVASALLPLHATFPCSSRRLPAGSSSCRWRQQTRRTSGGQSRRRRPPHAGAAGGHQSHPAAPAPAALLPLWGQVRAVLRGDGCMMMHMAACPLTCEVEHHHCGRPACPACPPALAAGLQVSQRCCLPAPSQR